MDPGVEFKAALEEADRLRLEVVCGDRDVDVTARKLSENFSLGVLAKLYIRQHIHTNAEQACVRGDALYKLFALAFF